MHNVCQQNKRNRKVDKTPGNALKFNNALVNTVRKQTYNKSKKRGGKKGGGSLGRPLNGTIEAMLDKEADIAIET
jgi:hypothetical protein